MARIISKLAPDEEKDLISNFKRLVGEQLKLKRIKCGLSQVELAKAFPVDNTVISRYESGSLDIPLSHLSLFSTYCDFDVRELFPKDMVKGILTSIKAAVSVISDREYRRQKKEEKDQVKQTNKTLAARIYKTGNIELRIDINRKPKSNRAKYRDAEMPAKAMPYSDEEFCDYVKRFDKETVDAVMDAGELLEKIKNKPKKDTLRDSVADYIVDEVIVSRIATKHPDEMAQRAYSYYKYLMDKANEERGAKR